MFRKQRTPLFFQSNCGMGFFSTFFHISTCSRICFRIPMFIALLLFAIFIQFTQNSTSLLGGLTKKQREIFAVSSSNDLRIR